MLPGGMRRKKREVGTLYRPREGGERTQEGVVRGEGRQVMETRRQTILLTVSDLVIDFMYYDRKEDNSLERGEIEAAVAAGEISWDEIVEEFRRCLMGRTK
jgi:hypothetical protein